MAITGLTINFAHGRVSGHITFASDDLSEIRSTVDFLVQAAVVSTNPHAEGRLIEAVQIPWFKIIEFIKRDPSMAFQIPPNKWEEMVAGAYSEAGFDEVVITPRSGDRGRDVIAIKNGFGSIRIIDQVKAYKPGHLVTANDVRALFGVLEMDGSSKGFLTTTSNFAPRIMKDPLLVKIIPSRIELINGTSLLEKLQLLYNKKI